MLFSVILAFIILLSFVRYRDAVLLYMAYFILVPRIQLQFGSILLKENVFNSIMLFSFFLYSSRKKIKMDFRPIVPFLLFFALTYIAIAFQTHVPDVFMTDMWRGTFMKVVFLPFIIWNLAKNDASFFRKSRFVFLLCIGIAVFYGLSLIFMNGYNPYYIYIQNTYGGDADLTYFKAYGDGRMFGRISSVFLHPMGFALFLGLSLVYVYSLQKQIKKSYFITLVALIGVMMLVCGVRSCIAAIGITLIYFLIKQRNFSLLLKFFFGGLCVFSAISLFPSLESYVMSIFDSNSSKVAGSSLEMRSEQLEAAFQEIKNDKFWGLGYSWTSYYISIYGDHPICLAFESLLFVIICNNGYFGFFIWGSLIVYIVLNTKKIIKKDKDVGILAKCVLVYYISYSCITGEYDYMRYFSFFYVLIMLNITQNQGGKAKMGKRRLLYVQNS